MILNPYETAIGSHVDTKKIESALNNLIVNNGDNFNYEYMNADDVKIGFITGKNDDEVNLPVWNHPILMKDFRGVKRVFVDVRQFVKVKKSDFLNLEEIVTNRPGFEFTVIKAVYIMLMEAGESISNIEFTLATAFSSWVSSSFRSVLTLGIEDTVKLEIITLHYILCILSDVDNTNHIDSIYFKISKLNRNVKNNIRYIEDVCKDLNHNPKSATDLMDNVDKGVNSPLIRNINTSVLYNVVGNTWNGVNSNENIVMAFDHVPTLIAMLYVSANNKSFKHSRLANVLNSNKRNIKLDDFTKTVSNMISEQRAIY